MKIAVWRTSGQEIMLSDISIGEIEWRELSIREKYWGCDDKKGKIPSIIHAANAKYYILEKKRKKLNVTAQRMLEKENWDIYFKVVDESASIVDEQYEIVMQKYRDVARLEDKMNDELCAQQMIFWILEDAYLSLTRSQVGK